jgi:hypothetical protein
LLIFPIVFIPRDMTKSDPETYSEEETVARREAALKRAFATPHKPQEASELGRAKARPNRSRKKAD